MEGGPGKSGFEKDFRKEFYAEALLSIGESKEGSDHKTSEPQGEESQAEGSIDGKPSDAVANGDSDGLAARDNPMPKKRSIAQKELVFKKRSRLDESALGTATKAVDGADFSSKDEEAPDTGNFPETIESGSSVPVVPKPQASRKRLVGDRIVDEERISQDRQNQWMIRFQELQQYVVKNASAMVPADYKENPQLGLWVRNQRKQKKLQEKGKKNALTEERMLLLESVGFEWDPYAADWKERFEELSEHYKIVTNRQARQRIDSNPRLHRWSVKQRYQYKLYKSNKPSQITEERIAMLDSIGFEWPEIKHDDWNMQYWEAKRFYLKHGDCLVYTRHNLPYLAKWLETQRANYILFQKRKKTQLTARRVQMLNDIGMEWSSAECKWKAGFVDLADHVRENGFGHVPSESQNKPLAKWVRKQQHLYSKGLLRSDRKELLQLLGILE